MTDDEWRDTFHRVELRLNTKAGNWTVSLWGGSLAVVMALLVWLTRR